jgi:hypothetical protein
LQESTEATKLLLFKNDSSNYQMCILLLER